MTTKLFLKVKPSYIFNVLAAGLLIIFIILNMMYESTKEEIVKINHKANIEYVSSLSKTLSIDIQRIVKKDFYNSLYDDFIAREYIESNLELFVTKKYQYIYLVAKKDETSDKLMYLTNKDFTNSYNPVQKDKYIEVYQTKKACYFKDDKELLATYVSPILVNEKVEALIIIKFSLEEKDTILLALKSLGDIFEMVFGFFILVFIFILWFSYIDTRRENEKNLVFKKLQESNTNLHTLTIELKIKSDKISEMNENLEERVKEEVSKNRAKDAQLIHQARLAQMGEMISMIAHQWRQPLNAISATSTSINLKAKLNKLDASAVQELSDNISKYSQHLSETIDDFRNFFKPDKEKVLTNYSYIIESVKTIIDTSLANKKIEVRRDLRCEESFESYPNELKQVVLNLIKNAEDALLETRTSNPYIKLMTYCEDGKYILEVSDNAGGIDTDIIDKIFDPYFSTKMEKDGTGLGLYMSKMIVEEHCHGILSVANIDGGTKFKIILGEASMERYL